MATTKTVPLYLFEDAGWRRFGPVTALRPVWELRHGPETLGERIARRLDRQPAGFLPRAQLLPMQQELLGRDNVGQLPGDGEIYLVNGRLAGDVPSEGLDPDCPWTVWTDGPDVIAARLPAKVAKRWLSRPVHDPRDFNAHALLAVWNQEQTAPTVRMLEQENGLAWWPWDLLARQAEAIGRAVSRIGDGVIAGDTHPQSILVEETNMHISEGAEVSAGAILDASKGPILLADGVTIEPGAILIGPVALGEGCTIRAGAVLRGPVTAGPVCKLGGEISETVFLGYANKQHGGYLGNAIVGEWVNLGAGTNNSDLKNNYAPVSVTIGGETINSGEIHFGAIIGDHVKTAINTQLNTGSVIGVGSNLFGAGFPPKTVGAFRWGGGEDFDIYDFEKFVEAARAAMGRRGRELSANTVQVLKRLHHEATAGRY